MSAISAATVHVILDYLCPLTAPLPAHLISKPLLQRHHFLDISPDNAADYLAWPSANPEEQSHAVAVLQSEAVPLHDHFQVNYVPDPHDIQAHVRITPDLRLIFLLDKQNGHWLYHNVALMPFPAHSYSSFDDALKAYSPDDFLPEQNHVFDQKDQDDEDSYWNAYGAGDDDSHQPRSDDYLDNGANSEDAYWAQYSAVQGSGDSTLPSPLPSKKKVLGGPQADTPLPDRIIVPSDNLQTNHVELYNPLEPPEPSSLVRRLEALSAESPSKSPTLFEFDGRPVTYPTPGELDSLSFNTAPDSPGAVPALSASSSTASPQPLQRCSDEFVVVDPAAAATVSCAVDSSLPSDSLILSHPSNDSHPQRHDPAQDILRENIKGFYQLWKLGRHDLSSNSTTDKEIFLDNVRQALEEL
ncbi:hypothetical protein D9613_001821 [Agrocybe pediades]|uniref:Uncharacterized protein n=1 Tax=Agrocybe pediades TaxID=84607 RepID=A0A8H4R7S8_9AGAR|nr:hypothetical protein D9613_001821 [Agrocybe pediades]